MTRSALITGGAGFIGFHLAKNLSDDGLDVTILDNFSRGREDEEFNELISRKNVQFIESDITEKSSFKNLPEFDYVYHLAAINGTGNFYNIPDQVLRVGVIGTLNVLDWFVNCEKGKILFSSSSETYAGALNLMSSDFPIPTPEKVPLVIDEPSNVRWSYGASKIIGEVAFHSYSAANGMGNFSIVRYHNIYGPRMGFEHVIPQFIERIERGDNPFNIMGGTETRSFCYVDDAVKATRLVMESEESNGKVINIGRSDGEISILELANKIFAVSDVNPEIEIMPAPEGSVKRRCPNVEELSALGFIPNVSLEVGLGRIYEWYHDYYRNEGDSS